METTIAMRPAVTVRDVEDILAARPLRPATFVLAVRDRGYVSTALTPGWAVWRSVPILVHWCAANDVDERRGLDCCRQALRAAGMQLQRCWDPDEGEYLAVLGWAPAKEGA